MVGLTWLDTAGNTDSLSSRMPVDGEGLPGKTLEKRWCLSLPESMEEWKRMKDDLGVYFKHVRQQMKMLFEIRSINNVLLLSILFF